MLFPVVVLLQAAALDTPQVPATPVPDATTPAAAGDAQAGDAQDGVVTLECTLQADRTLAGCVVLSETPSGLGFGSAAISSARRARLSPQSVEGVTSGGKVRFTIRFKVQD